MKCTHCNLKSCRSLAECKAISIDNDTILQEYQEEANNKIVRAAASLVDEGRAGTLSRLEELVQFIQEMKFKKVALAYCYGMEEDARKVSDYLKSKNIFISAVSCTAGSMAQNEVNTRSKYSGVSCNPIVQAEQLNSEGTQFTITMGLCLGHDILFNKYIQSYSTNLVVKDRVYEHNPFRQINNLG
jgi:uncharacterized metal-binding protein